jgi:hypothetical protein
VRVRLVLLLCVLAALLVAALPATAAARRAPQNFYGVSWDAGLNSRPEGIQEQQWELMARSGVESTRVVFSWAAAQPSPGGPISFNRTDRLVAHAARHGIQILPVVFEAPAWAQLDPSRRNSPPRHPGDYAFYLRTLVARYGSRGSFWAARPDLPRRPIREWQVWNEPDLAFYWNVPRDWTAAWPRGYVRLLKAARKAVKAGDRRGKIVLAGLSNRPWLQVRRLYRLKARRYFDVVAIHPYNAGLKSALEVARIVRGVMRRAHDGRKALWVTELGWPAARGRAVSLNLGGLKRLLTTDSGMAKRVGSTYDAFLDKRTDKRYGVGRVYWFTWASSYNPGEAGIWEYAGLVEAGPLAFIPTPALGAYRRSARHNEGCAKGPAGTCR